MTLGKCRLSGRWRHCKCQSPFLHQGAVLRCIRKCVLPGLKALVGNEELCLWLRQRIFDEGLNAPPDDSLWQALETFIAGGDGIRHCGWACRKAVFGLECYMGNLCFTIAMFACFVSCKYPNSVRFWDRVLLVKWPCVHMHLFEFQLEK